MLKNEFSTNDFFKSKQVRIGSYISKLHYPCTFAMLLVMASYLLTCYLTTENMACYSKDLPWKLVSAYCWMHGPFTIDDNSSTSTPYKGVGPVTDFADQEAFLKYYKFYQWGPVLLFLQGLCFYLPRHLWKHCENGKMESLVDCLGDPTLPANDRDSQLDQIAKYFEVHRGNHFVYALKFYLCETLYLFNIIAQIFFTDSFFNFELISSGSFFRSLFKASNQVGGDPWAKHFPKMAKCEFHMYGFSGTIEKHDSLCILPFNVINEMFFYVIWAWFICLAITTSIHLFGKLIVLSLPGMRIKCIMFYGNRKLDRNQVYDLINAESFNAFQRFGEWFILHSIASNLDRDIVCELIDKLSKSQESIEAKRQLSLSSQNSKRLIKMSNPS